MNSSRRSIPVCRRILPEQHHAAWLGETDNGNLKELLLPYPADEMRMWEISPRVNSPKNDDPSLWEPLHTEPAHRTIDGTELPILSNEEFRRGSQVGCPPKLVPDSQAA
jgi:hypothetical protein